MQLNGKTLFEQHENKDQYVMSNINKNKMIGRKIRNRLQNTIGESIN